MSDNTESLEAIALSLELLRRIPRNSKISTTDLHLQIKELGIVRNIKTTQRHLKMLCEHFDIECDDTSKPFGYRWKKNAQCLALPMLNEQESLLLTLAEQHLHNLLPASLMKSMEGFFYQARNNIGPHTDKILAQEWLTKVRVVSTTQPLLPPKINPGVFEEVSNALFNNRKLNLEYKNAAGVTSIKEVMPLGLAQQGPRMYLVCRYQDYDNERILALNRIITAKALTLSFQRPKEFDLQKYDADGHFGFGEGKRIRISFCIDKEAGLHLLESPLSTDQKVEEQEDCYKITATVVETAQLQWWLNSFGDQVWSIRRKSIKPDQSI